ncbi:glucan biosynthesis protein [Prosthecomicrobium hirschii]|uniref:glucan biosynthesis protein n=1 Tax=Prosthecodimorpha hirschii TaxID=665126 RepID=UPI0022207257|nr:glucan biosynthesis protein D [Prosthecomicrobium hirschii]MCW1840841.1 glucan biosynthesis protein [Prosthecomicrobium hirschii]
MTKRLSRRDLLQASFATAFAAGLGLIPTDAQAIPLKFGPAKPFSWDSLVKRAREMAGKPYKAPYRPAPQIVEQIDYTAHGKIRFKTDYALNVESGGYPISFFPIGRYFPKAIRMHAIDADKAREVLYEPEYFDMPEDSPAQKLPEDSGFAGFQIKEAKSRADWRTQDWAAFLGASYFRAIGANGEYGLSARGVAIDTASPTPEEFPDFTEFYIQPATAERQPVVIYALLDGPSIAGAYKFVLRRAEGVVIDVENALFMRKAVGKLGIAPMTSMFWFNEANKGYQLEWRRAAHDSDGLAMFTGAGERIWRPLVNPPRVSTSAFVDNNPRGFGLMQRSRDPAAYLDRWLNYERRPSLWIEPIGAWGAGSIQLVEIPTDHEDFDNIVCLWVPKEPIKAGDALDFRYRLHWNADEPQPATSLARAITTRIGRGGFPYTRKNPPEIKRIVIEFGGGTNLETLPKDVKPEAVITPSRGTLSAVFVETTSWNKNWRVQFDIQADGPEPVDIRCFLKNGETALSETWLYQLHPQQMG